MRVSVLVRMLALGMLVLMGAIVVVMVIAGLVLVLLTRTMRVRSATNGDLLSFRVRLEWEIKQANDEVSKGYGTRAP